MKKKKPISAQSIPARHLELMLSKMLGKYSDKTQEDPGAGEFAKQYSWNTGNMEVIYSFHPAGTASDEGGRPVEGVTINPKTDCGSLGIRDYWFALNDSTILEASIEDFDISAVFPEYTGPLLNPTAEGITRSVFVKELEKLIEHYK